MLRQIAFDTETTGLDWAGDDRIIELGAVEMINFVATGKTFQTFVNPGRSVSADTIRITGITDDKLVDQPPFDNPKVVDALLDFFGDSEIVAHNASFDRGFLNAELKRCGRSIIPEDRWIDTAAMARAKYPGSPASLDALCKRFDIGLESRTLHGALLDSQLLASVYLELNGGRARSFDFANNGGAENDSSMRKPAVQRPSPLPSRITATEAERHTAFIAEMGEAAVWNK